METWPIDRVVPYDQNPRVCPESAVRKVAGSIKAYGWRQPIVVDAAGVIIAGHTRHKAARLLGLAEVPVHVARGMTEAQIRAYRIADSRVAEETDWDKDLLALELDGLALMDDFDVAALGFNEGELDALLTTTAEADAARAAVTPEQARLTLAQRFGVPPFTVLDARQGYWQERKRAWIAKGIRSEIGRGSVLFGGGAQAGLKSIMDQRKGGLLCGKQTSDPGYYKRKAAGTEEARDVGWVSGTSVFDPVLCELAYRWFSPPDGVVLDPFAGGSVRGVVAAHLGRRASKAELALAAARRAGRPLVWHKVALRREPGKIDLRRPGFTHMLAFGNCGAGEATPDVIHRGAMLYPNATGLIAARTMVAWAMRHAEVIIDPFCGQGTIPAVAEALGAKAIGADIDPDQCAKARALRLRLA